MNLPKHKLTGDIAWSMGGFFILAACGVAINLIIAAFRDAASLGAFNQAYAVYVTASQVAVFGLHYSVMRHSALHDGDHDERGHLLMNASVFSLLLGIVAGSTVYAGAPLAGLAFDSPMTTLALRKAAPGLFIFPLNKVLLAYLNGLRRMKAFSVLQSCRYVFLALWIAAVAASPWSFDLASLGFFVAEAVTLAGIGAYFIKRSLMPAFTFDRRWRSWTGRHFAFGGKSLLAGLFVELNSRVDVLLLGVFLSDRAVGIYTFAAMLSDGMYQLLCVVRTVFNPVLVANLRDGDWEGLKKLAARARRLVFPAAATLAVGLVLAFWALAAFFMPTKGLGEGLVPVAILVAGMTLISGFVPFDNLMLTSGHPGLQTAQNLVVVCSNVAFNAVLIPRLELVGAATGTALSYAVGIASMIFLVHRKLRWNLLTNVVWR